MLENARGLHSHRTGKRNLTWTDTWHVKGTRKKKPQGHKGERRDLQLPRPWEPLLLLFPRAGPEGWQRVPPCRVRHSGGSPTRVRAERWQRPGQVRTSVSSPAPTLAPAPPAPRDTGRISTGRCWAGSALEGGVLPARPPVPPDPLISTLQKYAFLKYEASILTSRL